MTSNPWDARLYDTQFGFVGRYGDDLLDLLAPTSGEVVLDLGCGTGRHAAKIAARGAHVVGFDADPDMLRKARTDHPEITFLAGDAAVFGPVDLGIETPFDACFSNAALHWMTPQDAVLRNVRSVLAESGRFVAEMGGAGNVAALDASLREALRDLNLADIPVVTNYFPTTGEQSSALEAAGFRVELATWFPRPTPLDEGTTAADWTRHFRAATWAAVPEPEQERLGAIVNAHAANRGLLTDAGWTADYCRLRFVAVAV